MKWNKFNFQSALCLLKAECCYAACHMHARGWLSSVLHIYGTGTENRVNKQTLTRQRRRGHYRTRYLEWPQPYKWGALPFFQSGCSSSGFLVTTSIAPFINKNIHQTSAKHFRKPHVYTLLISFVHIVDMNSHFVNGILYDIVMLAITLIFIISIGPSLDASTSKSHDFVLLNFFIHIFRIKLAFFKL